MSVETIIPMAKHLDEVKLFFMIVLTQSYVFTQLHRKVVNGLPKIFLQMSEVNTR